MDSDQSGASTARAAYVGTSPIRMEDDRLLRGAGNFVDDHRAEDMLYCVIVRSTAAHAEIREIRSERAHRLPGVEGIITGRDAQQVWGPLPLLHMSGALDPKAYGVAVERVRYVGEPVAVVLGDSRHAALDGAALVEVEYSPLPVIESVSSSLAPSTPPLYEDWDTNVQREWQFDVGNVDHAFATAHTVVRESVSFHRHSGVPLETRGVLAVFDSHTQELHVRISTQRPHMARTLFAQVFGIPEAKIRVTSGDVGGGFGNKMQIDVDVVAVMAAIVSGRPVKWTETRSEWLTSAPAARDYAHEIEAAFDSDGRILAIRDDLTADVGCDGAARANGIGALVVAATYLPGPYAVANYAVRMRAVVTNKGPYGAYRGYGKDVANFAIERIMDAAAKRLGLDPEEVRRRNLVREKPYRMCTGPIVTDGAWHECLDSLVERMDLSARRQSHESERADGRLVGIGIATFLEASGASIPMSNSTGIESASVRMAADGSVAVTSSLQQIGQGIETAIAQVVADILAVEMSGVSVRWGDTNVVPSGQGAYSSRGVSFGLGAVEAAAHEVRRKLLKAAARFLERPPTDLSLSDGSIIGTDGTVTPIEEVAAAVYYRPGPYAMLPDESNPNLEATGTFAHSDVSWTPDELGRIRMYPIHGFGAQGADVEVDSSTGLIHVRQLWVVHDAGRIVNPKSAEGQVVGGVIQGLGGLMLEELAYDQVGLPQTIRLSDYQLPKITWAPPVDVIHWDSEAPPKGLGEAGCIGTASAVFLAVKDALAPLGVTPPEPPLTPGRMLDAIYTKAGT